MKHSSSTLPSTANETHRRNSCLTSASQLEHAASQHQPQQPPTKRRRKTPACATASLRPLKGLKSFAVEVAAKVRAAGGPTAYSDIADLLVEETLAKLEKSVRESQHLAVAAAAAAATAASPTATDESTKLQQPTSTPRSGNPDPSNKSLPTSPVTASPVQKCMPAAVPGAAAQYDAAYEEKNIRRRVYDALNVLNAMGLVCRTGKKEIMWRGTEGFLEVTHPPLRPSDPVPPNPHPSAKLMVLDGEDQPTVSTRAENGSRSNERQVGSEHKPTESTDTVVHGRSHRVVAPSEDLRRSLAEARQRVNEKRARSTDLQKRLNAVQAESLTAAGPHCRAAEQGARVETTATDASHAKKVQLPFTLLATDHRTEVNVEVSDDRQTVCVNAGRFRLVLGEELLDMLASSRGRNPAGISGPAHPPVPARRAQHAFTSAAAAASPRDGGYHLGASGYQPTETDDGVPSMQAPPEPIGDIEPLRTPPRRDPVDLHAVHGQDSPTIESCIASDSDLAGVTGGAAIVTGSIAWQHDFASPLRPIKRSSPSSLMTSAAKALGGASPVLSPFRIRTPFRMMSPLQPNNQLYHHHQQQQNHHHLHAHGTTPTRGLGLTPKRERMPLGGSTLDFLSGKLSFSPTPVVKQESSVWSPL